MPHAANRTGEDHPDQTRHPVDRSDALADVTPRDEVPWHIHGQSLHAAKNLGCPDPRCVALATADRQALRRKRRAERKPGPDGALVHPDAPHGTDNGYTNYGCRCPECSAAGTAASAARRPPKQR